MIIAVLDKNTTPFEAAMSGYGKPIVAIFNKLIYIQFNIYIYVIFFNVFNLIFYIYGIFFKSI